MYEPYVAKRGQQLFIACVLVCVSSPQCPVLITALCTFMHLPTNTIGLMQRALLCTQVHMEPAQGASATLTWTQANHHGYGPFGLCWLADIIVMTRDWLPPVGSHWPLAPGWWCHHVWHVTVDVASRHALLGMDGEIRSKLEVMWDVFEWFTAVCASWHRGRTQSRMNRKDLLWRLVWFKFPYRLAGLFRNTVGLLPN